MADNLKAQLDVLIADLQGLSTRLGVGKPMDEKNAELERLFFSHVQMRVEALKQGAEVRNRNGRLPVLDSLNQQLAALTDTLNSQTTKDILGTAEWQAKVVNQMLPDVQSIDKTIRTL